MPRNTLPATPFRMPRSVAIAPRAASPRPRTRAAGGARPAPDEKMTDAEKAILVGVLLAIILLLYKRIRTEKVPLPPGRPGQVTDGSYQIVDSSEDDTSKIEAQIAHGDKRIRDLVSFDPNRAQPNRRPTTADNIIIDAILSENEALARPLSGQLGDNIRSRIDETRQIVALARTLSEATSSREPAPNPNDLSVRRLDIEAIVRDWLAVSQKLAPTRRPSDTETRTVRSLIAESNQILTRLVTIDPSIDWSDGDQPLQAWLDAALKLPASTTKKPPKSSWKGSGGYIADSPAPRNA